jgi:hypothetical protein
MDRYGPRLIRGVAAASVSIFLVAGAAFAANAVMGPPSVGPNFAPAAAVRPPLGASKVAEPTETAEPTEAARPARSAEPAETAEPSETPDAQDQSGGHGDGGSSHGQGGSDQGGNG